MTQQTLHRLVQLIIVASVMAAVAACAGAGKGAAQGAAARSAYPEIIRWDRAINSKTEVDVALQNSLQDLRQIRADYDLPLTCTS